MFNNIYSISIISTILYIEIYFEGRNNVGRWADPAHNAALSMHVDHTHVDHGSSCRSVTQFRDRPNPYVPNPYD